MAKNIDLKAYARGFHSRPSSAAPAHVVTKKPSVVTKQPNVVTPMTAAERQRRHRAKDREGYNKYMRDYRSRPKEAKEPELAQGLAQALEHVRYEDPRPNDLVRPKSSAEFMRSLK